MYMRIFSDPASRCARSPDNRAPRGDSDRKAARTEARTSARRRAVRVAAEASERLSRRPLYKKSRAHRSVPCDKKLDVPWNFPFVGPEQAIELAIEMTRAPQKSPRPCVRPASIGSHGASSKDASLCLRVRSPAPLCGRRPPTLWRPQASPIGLRAARRRKEDRKAGPCGALPYLASPFHL